MRKFGAGGSYFFSARENASANALFAGAGAALGG
jgi:hypothetical protein